MAGSGNLLLVTLMIAPLAVTSGTLILAEMLAPNAYTGFAPPALWLVVFDGRFVRWMPRCSRLIDPARSRR